MPGGVPGNRELAGTADRLLFRPAEDRAGAHLRSVAGPWELVYGRRWLLPLLSAREVGAVTRREASRRGGSSSTADYQTTNCRPRSPS